MKHFDAYISSIKILHSDGIISPDVILKSLFRAYLNNSKDKNSLFSVKQPYIEFCQRFIADDEKKEGETSLLLSEKNIHAMILALNQYPGMDYLDSDSEFAELLSAFFSIYTQYAAQLKHEIGSKLKIANTSIACLNSDSIIDFLVNQPLTENSLKLFNKMFPLAKTAQKQSIINPLLKFLATDKSLEIMQSGEATGLIIQAIKVIEICADLLNEEQLKEIISIFLNLSQDRHWTEMAESAEACLHYCSKEFKQDIVVKLCKELSAPCKEDGNCINTSPKNFAAQLLNCLVEDIGHDQWPIVIETILKIPLTNPYFYYDIIKFLDIFSQKIPEEFQEKLYASLFQYIQSDDPTLRKFASFWIVKNEVSFHKIKDLTINRLIQLLRRKPLEEIINFVSHCFKTYRDKINLEQCEEICRLVLDNLKKIKEDYGWIKLELCEIIANCAPYIPKTQWSDIITVLLGQDLDVYNLRGEFTKIIEKCVPYIPDDGWPKSFSYYISSLNYFVSCLPKFYLPAIIDHLLKNVNLWDPYEGTRALRATYSLISHIPDDLLKDIVNALLYRLRNPWERYDLVCNHNSKVEEGLGISVDLLGTCLSRLKTLAGDEAIAVGLLLLQGIHKQKGIKLLISILPYLAEDKQTRVMTTLMDFLSIGEKDCSWDDVLWKYSDKIYPYVPKNLWPAVKQQLLTPFLLIGCEVPAEIRLDFIDIHLPYLSSSDSEKRKQAWKILTSIAIPEKHKLTVAKAMIEEFSRPYCQLTSEELRQRVFYENPILGQLAPILLEDQWPMVINKLFSDFVNDLTPEIMESCARYIPSSQWDTITSLLIMRMQHEDKSAREKIIRILEVCIPHIPKIQLLTVAIALIGKLTDTSKRVRNAALSALESLYVQPQLNYPEKIFIHSHISSLMSELTTQPLSKEASEILLSLVNASLSMKHSDVVENEVNKHLLADVSSLVMQYC